LVKEKSVSMLTNLDRLNNDYRLEEGKNEGGQPIHRLLFAPLHAVENSEESRHDNTQKHNCNHITTKDKLDCHFN